MNPKVIKFLKLLQQNNNRDWFSENKQLYLDAKAEFDDFVNHLIADIELFDASVRGLSSKNTVYRIYRDIRFSKDKTPYKRYFSAYIAPGGRKSKMAGYYIHIEPGNCLAGGGLHCPAKEILNEVRFEIYNNPEEFTGIIEDNSFKNLFGEIIGDKLIRPPKGFPKEFPLIEWIKHKEFITAHPFPDELVTNNKFIPYLLKVFKTLKPMNDFLNRPLIG